MNLVMLIMILKIFLKIKSDDPVVKAIGAEPGNVLRITRESQTAGVFVTYRIVGRLSVLI